jgi:hypothetical protein
MQIEAVSQGIEVILEDLKGSAYLSIASNQNLGSTASAMKGKPE